MNKLFKSTIANTLMISLIAGAAFVDVAQAQDTGGFKKARVDTEALKQQNSSGIKTTTTEVITSGGVESAQSSRTRVPSSDLQRNAALNDAAYSTFNSSTNPRRGDVRTQAGSYDVNAAKPTSATQRNQKSASGYSSGLNTQRSTSTRPKSTETYAGYERRSAGDPGKMSGSNRTVISPSQRGNSARSINFSGMKEGNTNYNSNRTRRSSSYATYYGDSSLKVYDQRGRRVSPTTSNKNRTVIIVPRTGKTVTGLVTSDDPGRTITIKDPSGASISFSYSDMDALVNI